jgi:glucose uptake protein GlcU
MIAAMEGAVNVRAESFLRRFLLADAVISGMSGVIMLGGAGALDQLLGFPASLFRAAGIVLLPFAGLVLYWGTREDILRARVWTVIVLNLVWVAGSVGLLVAGPIEPNAFGMAFVIVQAVVVAVFAELQYSGLRSLAVSPGER